MILGVIRGVESRGPLDVASRVFQLTSAISSGYFLCVEILFFNKKFFS
jgi:hypothetical protein